MLPPTEPPCRTRMRCPTAYAWKVKGCIKFHKQRVVSIGSLTTMTTKHTAGRSQILPVIDTHTHTRFHTHTHTHTHTHAHIIAHTYTHTSTVPDPAANLYSLRASGANICGLMSMKVASVQASHLC